jgi:glutathione peroxidase
LVTAFFIIVSFTANKPKSIYSFSVPAIEGGVIDFSAFKGKKILIVNTASACQYTYQYAALQTLYSSNKDKLVIIGFPSNQFNQEEGSGDDINKFCKTRYGVTLPIAAKTPLLGDSASPVYKWLCSKAENGVLDATIKWNFNKFLINEKGKLIAHFPSNVKPDSEEILKYLK